MIECNPEGVTQSYRIILRRGQPRARNNQCQQQNETNELFHLFLSINSIKLAGNFKSERCATPSFHSEWRNLCSRGGPSVSPGTTVQGSVVRYGAAWSSGVSSSILTSSRTASIPISRRGTLNVVQV